MLVALSLHLVVGLWRYPTGSYVSSSPAVEAGVVYVGSGGATYTVRAGVLSSDGYLNAVNATSGMLVWRYPTGSSVHSSPAAEAGVVYVGSDNGYLHAVDATSGVLVWRYRTSGFVGGMYGGKVSSSPAVDSGVVFVGGGGDETYLDAVDATSGVLVWRYRTGGFVYSSPAVEAGVVYVGSNDGYLYAVDATSGVLVWRYPTGGQVGSSPAVEAGVVYVGSHDDYLYAVDATSGVLVWRYPTGGHVDSSPAVEAGVVYVGSDDSYLYAVDATSGVLLWRYPTGGYVKSSPAVEAGMVYVGSDDGMVHAVNTTSGVLVSLYPTGGQVGSSPTVEAGVVYVGSNDKYLYALSPCSAAPAGTPACSTSTCAAGGTFTGSVHFANASHAIAGAHFANASQPMQCPPCPMGFVKPDGGAGSCTPCAAGAMSEGGSGATACVACGDPLWCLAGGACVVSRTGLGCGACADGFRLHSGACTVCPEQGWVTALPLLVIAAFALAFVLKFGAAMRAVIKDTVEHYPTSNANERAADYAVAKTVGVNVNQVAKSRSQAKASYALMRQVAALMTVTGFAQMSGSIIAMDFDWPISVTWPAGVLANIASLDVTGAAAPECAYKLSSSARWALELAVPLSPLFVLGFAIAWLKLAEAPFCCAARILSFQSRDLCFFRKCARCMGGFIATLQAKALRCACRMPLLLPLPAHMLIPAQPLLVHRQLLPHHVPRARWGRLRAL
jgi:outer membrane protein assembly factor BamB